MLFARGTSLAGHKPRRQLYHYRRPLGHRNHYAPHRRALADGQHLSNVAHLHPSSPPISSASPGPLPGEATSARTAQLGRPEARRPRARPHPLERETRRAPSDAHPTNRPLPGAAPVCPTSGRSNCPQSGRSLYGRQLRCPPVAGPGARRVKVAQVASGRLADRKTGPTGRKHPVVSVQLAGRFISRSPARDGGRRCESERRQDAFFRIATHREPPAELMCLN